MPRVQPGSPLARLFPHEVTLYVAVGARAAASDSGNVSAMVDALEEDLKKAGRVVDIVGARLGEQPPLPRLEIQVSDSDSGSATLRGAGNLSQLLMPVTGVALVGAGGGHMVVDAWAVTADNVAQYEGHYSAGSFGANGADAAIAAGERVGHSIMRHLSLTPFPITKSP
ncbi:MAG TPA: hypothetical protein VHB79_08695 [Polyangiaceae bacterium]|nr:hypothetical protein [Polyangiaceae bacterium]